MHLKKSNRTTNRSRPMTVHFPLPRKAVSKLRELAIGKDSRLLDLGVLAVQISDDESIVLGIELDKTKKKSPVYVNKAASSTYPHSSGNRVSFNSKTLDPRSFTTPSTFDPLSHNHKGATYASRFLQTTRTDNFGLKTKKTAQNSAAKRRAKETLNAARRGRGRGRAGKASGQSNASIRASTWEMVYSHIGLPRDHRNKATNLLEPSVGSQASGIANVPVVQTELPRENILKSDRKRKISASSPPLKSPGQTGVYSEDDSSVSSSPCSHSPMNSEELMNLFVDSNFSATSVLKQLAESCSKGEEKQTNSENKLDKIKNSFGSGVEGSPKMKESGCSNAAVYDSSPQCGNFPNTGPPVSNIKNSNYISSPKTSKPVKGIGSSDVNLSNTSSMNLSSTPGKRPASILGDLYTGLSHVSSKSSLSLSKSALHDSKSKRARTELEIQRDKINKANELNLQKSTDCVTSQSLNQPETSALSPSNDHLDDTSVTAATTTATNVALRNYLQYGYYYSAEDLNRALAKTGSLKSKNNHQMSVSASSPSSTMSTMSVSPSAHTTLKPKIQNEQPASKEPAPEVLSSNSSEQQIVDPSHKPSGCPDSETILKTSDSSKMDESMTFSSDINKFNSSSSTEKLTTEKSQCIAGAQSLTSSASDTPLATAVTTSSPTLMTSSDATPLTGTVADSSSNVQSNGKCYAISYVYPMGTVWYPYVAITPYTVLQKNASKSSEPEKRTNDKEGTSGGGDTSSQYIDLASSLRYWQQLSLLYKNQMLVTASANTNILGSSLSTLGQNAIGVGSNITSGVPSDLSKQSTTISVVGSKSEKAPFSFSLSESGSSVASMFSKQPKQDVSSNSSSSEKKPVRRASVIVAAKTSNTGSSSRTNSTDSLENNRSSSSTPESVVSSDGMPLVIDNCNRLIEEHCNRMSAVLAATPEDQSHNPAERASSTTPLLSFIPDSSIAYVNVGNNSSKKTAGNGKDGKSKSSKKKKSTKNT